MYVRVVWGEALNVGLDSGEKDVRQKDIGAVQKRSLFSAKPLEIFVSPGGAVSHRPCEILGSGSTTLKSPGDKVRHKCEERLFSPWHRTRYQSGTLRPSGGSILGMQATMYACPGCDLHVGTQTKGWEWGSSPLKASKNFLCFAQKALWSCGSPFGVAMAFPERVLCGVSL